MIGVILSIGLLSIVLVVCTHIIAHRLIKILYEQKLTNIYINHIMEDCLDIKWNTKWNTK